MKCINTSRKAIDGVTALPGTITLFCEDTHERGFYPIILQELERDIYIPFHQRNEDNAIPGQLAEQHARYASITNTFDRSTDSRLVDYYYTGNHRHRKRA